MHQSCTVPEVARLVSCLLGRDTYGYRYGKAVSGVEGTEKSSFVEGSEKRFGRVFDDARGQGVNRLVSECTEVHDGSLSASHEKVEFAVQDMPIVGTSSLEKQGDANEHRGAAAESHQDSVLGGVSVKRERSEEDLRDARVDKRVKVESDAGLPGHSVVYGNGTCATVVTAGEACQDVNPRALVARVQDDLKPSLPVPKPPAAAPIDTDLTGLFNDLDDSDVEDDEFVVHPDVWPEALPDTWRGNFSITGNGGQAPTTEIESVPKLSSEQVDGNLGSGTRTQVHTPLPETVICLAPDSLLKQAESGNENGSLVQAHVPLVEAMATVIGASSEQVQANGKHGTMVQAVPPLVEAMATVVGASSEPIEANGNHETMVQAAPPLVEAMATVVGASSEPVEANGNHETEVQADPPQAESLAVVLGASSEQAQRSGDIGSVVPAHTPPVEALATTLGSPKQAQTNGSIGHTVPALGAARYEKSSAEIVVLDSDSDDDDDFIMFEGPQVKSAVKSEPGVRNSEAAISQVGKAVKMEPESRKQPETNQQSFNAQMAELLSQRQPQTSYQTQNSVMAEAGSLRQAGANNHMSNAVKAEAGIQRQPEAGYHMQTAVKAEAGSQRQVEASRHMPNAVMAEAHIQRQAEAHILRQAEAHIQRQAETSHHMPNAVMAEASHHMSNAVMAEAHSQRQPGTSYHMQNAALAEAHTRRQAETSYYMQNAVMAEAHSQRQAETSYQMQNAMMAAAHSQRQLETRYHIQNAAVVADAQNRRQPETSYQMQNAVMAEAHSQRQPETSYHMQSAALAEAHTRRQTESSYHMQKAVMAEAHIRMQPETSFQMQTSVVAEALSQRQAETGYQMQNAVMAEAHTQRQPGTSYQMQNAVMAEAHNQRQPEASHQMQNAVMAEAHIQRQPETSYHMQNAVMADAHSRRQPETSHHTQNAAMADAHSQRQPETSYQMPNHFIAVPESRRQSGTGSQLPNVAAVEVERQRQLETSYRLGNSVKQEPGTSSSMMLGVSCQSANVVKLESGATGKVPNSRGNQGSGPLPMPQAPPGFVFQTQVQNGGLKWALVPQSTAAAVSPPNPVNNIRSRPQSSALPSGLPFGLGSSSGVAPNNVREPFPSGERAEPSRSSIPSTSSAGMPPYGGHTQPSGMGNGNHALAGQAVVSAPPSSFQPADNNQQAIVKREAAEAWTPPNSAAVVPFRYDGTVSAPRYEVTRALQQYRYYIDKAKDDRVKEYEAREARRDLVPNDGPKEGSRRGLDSRPDIVAYNDIKKAKADVNPGVNVGDLPGVEVGDTFTYRHQMAVVGLHRLPNVGIDYGYPPPDNIPTATAIVMMPKAGYVDDKDYGTTILYTGQGGRKKRNQGAPFVCDQELKKGNLALAKNHERGLPVRVIRGHMGGSGSNGPGFLGYSYDGLYTIVSYEFSEGMNGFKVYKYTMARLESQPPIPPCIVGCTSHQWNTGRRAIAALPLQAVDPTVDVKPICMQVMEPPVEMKQICI